MSAPGEREITSSSSSKSWSSMSARTGRSESASAINTTGNLTNPIDLRTNPLCVVARSVQETLRNDSMAKNDSRKVRPAHPGAQKECVGRVEIYNDRKPAGQKFPGSNLYCARVKKKTVLETDRRLLEACRAGNQAAWERLVLKYRHLVYSIALRSRLDADQAGDVFQSVFL